MRALRFSTLATVGLLLLPGLDSGAAAQQASTGSEPGMIGAPLMDLPGELVPVRYSSGSLQRAGQLQPAFELLAKEFARGTGRKQRLPLMLLSRREWEEADLAMPYGLPARTSGGSSLALAAWGDSGSVALWKGLLTQSLPVADEAPLRSTSEEAASLVPADLLGMFEGSRMLMERAGIKGSERWITEVVAHSMAASVAGALSGGGQAVSMYRHLARREGPPLPLEGYRSGISLQDWLWYQSQFFAAAVLILQEDNRGGRALLKHARKNDGSISRADMITRHSALDSWLLESFAAAPSE